MAQLPRPRVPRPPTVPLPAPIARLLHLLGLPVTETATYWRQEQRSLARGATALVIGLFATLIAGLVLGAARGPLEEHPGLLVLIPAAIGMRGSIFGSMASRLGTAILTGQFEPTVERGNWLGKQIEAAGLLTITTSTLAGVLAWVIGRVLSLEVVPMLDLIAVSLLGGLLSSLALLVVTVQIARMAQDRGWNMDDVGAPTITATGDLITLPALLIATLLLEVPYVPGVIGLIGVAAAIWAAVHGWREDDPNVRRVVRESLVVLTLAVTIDVLAGLVMESRADQLLTIPALLVLIPPFIANCGSLGGMLASRLASKLHVGLLEPRAFPGKLAALDISTIFLLAALAFTGVGTVGWVAARLAGLQPPGIGTLVAVTLVAGVFATLLIAVVAYTTATATFRFGLDPDNHGIPIVTAAMDLLGILCLVGAIALLRVG